jgi:hypothetical protein
MASYCAIEPWVVSAVEGDNVGSDCFGNLTLREELSKPLPIPESWFCWINSSSIWSGVGPSACALAASAPAAAVARKVRRVSECTIKHQPRHSRCAIAHLEDASFGAGLKSIRPVVVMDSGLALRAPRNDSS